MNKLELKHIAPYLPYKLEVVEIYNDKVISDSFIVDVVNWDSGSVGGSEASLDSFELERGFKMRDIKPILRSLESISSRGIKELGEEVFGEQLKDAKYTMINTSFSSVNIDIDDFFRI